MIITPKELAHRWNCSVFHIYKLVREDKLPYFKIGNRIIRFRSEAIDAYECQQTNGSSSTEANGVYTVEQLQANLSEGRLGPPIAQRQSVGSQTSRPSSLFVPPLNSGR